VALAALKTLTNSRIILTELMGFVVEGKGGFEGYNNAFLSAKNQASLCSLLDAIWDNDRGNILLRDWVSSHAVGLVCNTIHTEMENAKPHLKMGAKEATTDFVNNWDITTIMGPVSQNITPTWSKVLEAATESKVSQRKAVSAKSRNRITVGIVSPNFEHLH